MSKDKSSVECSENALQQIENYNYGALDPDALGGIIEAMIAVADIGQGALHKPKNECLNDGEYNDPLLSTCVIAINTAKLAYEALMAKFEGDYPPTVDQSTIEAIVRFQAASGLWTPANEMNYALAVQSIWRREQMESTE